MGIFERIASISNPQTHLLEELAETAGLTETLVDRLRLHAPRCPSPRLKEALERVADGKEQHLKTLRQILNTHRMWPKKLEALPHDGLNNWERVTGDLELASRIESGLGRQWLQWEGVDSGVSQTLRQMLEENGRLSREIREVAAKLDPQALD